MPFALQAQNGEESIYGHLESYEVSTGETPLLISLYCQVALGMIKDLTRGTVSVMKKGQRYMIPLFKCSRTGLLLLNLTRGLDDMDPSSHKFLRRYVPHPFDTPGRSIAMAAVGADEPGAAVLQKLSGLEGVPWTMFNGVTVVSATQETSVPKVHGDPAVVEEIDCRDLNDPHHDRQSHWKASNGDWRYLEFLQAEVVDSS